MCRGGGGGGQLGAGAVGGQGQLGAGAVGGRRVPMFCLGRVEFP